MKATHRIKAATITRIALCKRGKNGFRTILKDDGSFCVESITKAVADNELLTVVYAPNRPDDDGHAADAPVIKSIAHAYQRDHRELDIEHDGKVLPDASAYVAESFIVGKGDERFQGWKDYENNDVGDLTGAWAAVIKLEDPALQKASRDGELDGVSMFGKAALELVDKSAAPKRVAERLGKSHNPEEIDMDESKLKEVLAAFKTELVEVVKSMIAPADDAPEAKPKPSPKPPYFTGNLSKATDLEAFESELRAFELNKAMQDGTLTADKVSELRKALAVGQPSDKDADIEDADTPHEKYLKRELFKARKSRNAPEGSPKPEDNEVALAKANNDEGLAIAKILNERSGAPTSGMRVLETNKA